MSKEFKTVLLLLYSSWRGQVRLWQLVNVIASQRSWRGNPVISSNIIIVGYSKIFLLTLLLILPIGCSCFPDKSQEIEKEREWDKKSVELRKELHKHSKPVYERLKAFQQKVPDLDEKKLFQDNDMKVFLKTMYAPYLSALQVLNSHLAKHERDPAQKTTYTQASDYISWCLRKWPTWIRENNTTHMYGLVLSDIKQAQEGALKKELQDLQEKFPGLDKEKRFPEKDIKELLKKRYIPYLYALKAHATYFAIHGEDKKKSELQGEANSANKSLQEVAQLLQDNNTDQVYKLIEELRKKF